MIIIFTLSCVPQSRVINIRKGHKFTNLENVFKNINSGDTLHIYAGTYYTNNVLELNGKTDIRIIGHGKVQIYCRKISQNILLITNCKNITIKNLLVSFKPNTRSAGILGNSLYVKSSNNVNIINCHISDSQTCGLFLNACTNVYIKHCKIINNEIAGIYLRKCQNIHVVSNTLTGNQDAIINDDTNNVLTKNNSE